MKGEWNDKKPLNRAEAEQARIWEVIHNATLDRTADPRKAVVEADRITGLVRRGYSYDANVRAERHKKEEQAAAYERRTARAALIRRWKWRGAWTLTWATVAALIALFTWSMFYMEGNDYAGFDQKFVYDSAHKELVEWYGEERLPKHVVARSKERSSYFGTPAWKVKYQLPGAQGIRDDVACVFVWGGSDEDDNADQVAVREGAHC